MSKPRAIVPLWRPETHEPSDLYDPNAQGTTNTARLTYRGGPLLTNAEIAPIFWGSHWDSDSTLVALRAQLLLFLDFFVSGAGPMVTQLAEYSTPKYQIGPGAVLPEVLSSTPAWGATVKDSQIQYALKRGAFRKLLPPIGPETLYVVYLQPGTTVVQSGDRSCQVFCGYHNVTSGYAPNLYYAVLPYPSCDGCTGGMTPQNALTSITSHEISEACTDPIPGRGWYDDAHGEIGDICAWDQKGNGTWTWQAEYSNAAGGCT